MAKEKKPSSGTPLPNFDLPRQDDGKEEIVDPAIQQLRNDVAMLKDKQEKSFQMIQEKGLEVGLSHVIVNDITYIMGILDRAKNIWESPHIKEMEAQEDNEIMMIRNRGEDIVAFSRKEAQVLRMRNERIKIGIFIEVTKETMAMLLGRVRFQKEGEFR